MLWMTDRLLALAIALSALYNPQKVHAKAVDSYITTCNSYLHSTPSSGQNSYTSNVFAIRGGEQARPNANGSGFSSVLQKFGRKLSKKQQSPLEALQEQTLWLEEQLRYAQDSLQQTRSQLIAAQAQVRQDRHSQWHQAKEEYVKQEQEFRDEIRQLQNQIKGLEKLLKEVQQLLSTEQEKVKDLEERLRQMTSEKQSIKEDYVKKIQELRTELEAKAQSRLDDMEKEWQGRLNTEVEKAKQSTAEHWQVQLKLERERLESKSAQAQAALQKESDEAVERERIKLRKLVSALAEREKKLLGESKKVDDEFEKIVVASSRSSNNDSGQVLGSTLKPVSQNTIYGTMFGASPSSANK